MAEPTFPPTTWMLLQHIEAALKLIAVQRGYYTDLGQHAIALDALQLPESDAPYTLILCPDMPVNEDSSTRSTTRTDMEVVIEFTVPFGWQDNAQLAAHRARADVMRALVPLRKHIKDRPLGVNSFEITGSRIGTPDDGASVVIAQVTVRAGLSESTLPASP